jgi:hypothetical protein
MVEPPGPGSVAYWPGTQAGVTPAKITTASERQLVTKRMKASGTKFGKLSVFFRRNLRNFVFPIASGILSESVSELRHLHALRSARFSPKSESQIKFGG